MIYSNEFFIFKVKIMALQNSRPHDPHLEDHVISVDVGQPELAVSAAAS